MINKNDVLLANLCRVYEDGHNGDISFGESEDLYDLVIINTSSNERKYKDNREKISYYTNNNEATSGCFR